MTGNASNISPYIIHNEIKLFDPRQQEPIFREYWKNIFTSEDPNDNNFVVIVIVVSVRAKECLSI